LTPICSEPLEKELDFEEGLTPMPLNEAETLEEELTKKDV
jgi:hypothetical protein